MPGLRAFAVLSLACAFAAFPVGSPAQDAPPAGDMRLNFVPPKGWTDTTMSEGRPGLWKSWRIRDGDAVHSIVLSVTRENRNAEASVRANAAALTSLAGTSNLSMGAATACGDVPAYALSYRSDRTPGHPMIIRHLFVDIGPLIGDISYAHPPETAERPDAAEAMSTLCDQRIYAMRAPLGWRGGAMRSSDHPGVDAYVSPGGDQTLIALAVSAGAGMAAKALAPTVVGGGATVIADAEESCGTTRVRHSRWRSPGTSGTGTAAGAPQLVEQVAGYRHGVSYLYTYTRGVAAAADPDAERALTSFCAPDARLATPPPAAQPATTPSPVPVI